MLRQGHILIHIMSIPSGRRAPNPLVRVALVRHGETDWNVDGRLQGSSDIPLNDIGRRQAREAGTVLTAEPWDVLLSSPLSRAAETADIIGHVVGLERSGDDADLVERRFGHAEGMTGYEAWAHWPDGAYPGAESYHDLAVRGRRGLDRIASVHPGEKVVAVAHGGVIRAILHTVMGRPAPRIANAGISTLVGDGRDWTVESINSIPLRRRR